MGIKKVEQVRMANLLSVYYIPGGDFMDSGALTSLIVMVALSLIALICAVALIKVCFIDPKKVAGVFRKIAPELGFSLTDQDPGSIKHINDLLLQTYTGRTKLGKFTVNVLTAMEKRTESGDIYISDLNVVNYSHQGQSYSLITNLFLGIDLQIPGCLYIRRKLPDIYEKLLSTVEGECVAIEEPVQSFENRFAVKTSDKSMLKYLTSEIQEYIVNQYDRYPFPDVQGATTSISTARDIFIFDKGISINGPRTWNRKDIKDLYDFGVELAKIIGDEIKKVNFASSKIEEEIPEEEQPAEEKQQEMEVHKAGTG